MGTVGGVGSGRNREVNAVQRIFIQRFPLVFRNNIEKGRSKFVDVE